MTKRSSRDSTRRTTHSNTYRFFVDPGAFTGSQVLIEDNALVHQLGTVLRLGPGQSITLLDNQGFVYTVELEQLNRHHVRGRVVERTAVSNEARLSLTLYVALLRGERFEWVLQKGTELGVQGFVPVVTDHAAVDDKQALSPTKGERWQRIIREAAEQSRRGRLPELHAAQPFAGACERAGARGQAVLLWEGAGGQSLRSVLAPQSLSGNWAVFSGPEGGWSEREVAAAQHAGIPLASLGPRTLRAETAPLIAATALLWEAGDLD